MTTTEQETLKFAKVRLSDRNLLEPILSRWGENSCQHSFATLYCLQDKYGDEFCIRDGWLYIHRSHLDTKEYRVYLAPMGAGAGRTALQHLLADAHAYGKKLRLESITESAAQRLGILNDSTFAVYKDRDLAEYFYTKEKLTELPGHHLASKRTDINRFFRVYGERFRIETIMLRHLADIRVYQAQWFDSRAKEDSLSYLHHENKLIDLALDCYEELGLSGIVAFLDDRICGYAFGYPLSDTGYDVMVEKGSREVKDIYRILNRELVVRCCDGIRYINREEDLGVMGLRKAKESYYPDVLLEKFIAAEV